MSQKSTARPHGQIRQSQMITTFVPGAMLDLPNHSVLSPIAPLNRASATK